jgi:2-polyprenyl-3-methyl-5-hydroxy-6-metoxy-1,4-benzoquinol methylase
MTDRTSAEIYNYTAELDAESAAAKIWRFVAPGQRVLDLGAGPGALARPLSQAKGCRVTAVEVDAASVDALKGFCEHVVQANLNEAGWAETVPAGPYDVVLLADVLEHLYDPWTALNAAKRFIGPDGAIVISLPHAAHAALIGCLIGDDFHYNDWGLLDRTHIRFFAIKNIQALVERAGLKIVDADFVMREPEETEFAAAWAALPEGQRAMLRAGTYAKVYQVVLKAVPSERPEPARLLADFPVPMANRLKYIAFYLPQFHPIPENDAWWGKGFTEWTNVTKAVPLFPGHYQPHLPADLGFYDLRLREVQHQQIAMAQAAGIDAFCFHFYWFGGGKRLLEKPVDDFLADKDARIDFCLCWANENWTRKWDATDHLVLQGQRYLPEDDIAFIESVIPFFRDPRYLRVDGAPLLIVYRPQHMPDPRASAERWRAHCRAAGIGEIHLVAALTHGNLDFEQFGYDAGVEFPPHNSGLTNLRDIVPANPPIAGAIGDFSDFAQRYVSRDYSGRRVYRSVVPSWDNAARVEGRGLVLLDGTPDNYERWLKAASELTVAERSPSQRLIFLNGWNEWAEGCHLEPDRKYGHGFLHATARVKAGTSEIDPAYPPRSLDFAPPPAPAPAPAPPPIPALEEPPRSLRGHIVHQVYMALHERPRAFRIARALYKRILSRPRPPRA